MKIILPSWLIRILRFLGRPFKAIGKWINHNFVPLVILGVWILVMLLINFSHQIANNTSATKKTAENTNQITRDLKKVLCEDIPDKECNFTKVITQIELDHQRQDRFESCLLALSGKPDFEGVDVSVIGQCDKMSRNVGLSDVTKPQATSNSSPPTASPQTQPDTSGQPDKAPPPNPPKQNIVQKAGSGIVNLAKKIGNLL